MRGTEQESAEFEPIIFAAKRLGIRRHDGLPTWFCSWSPRNENYCAEGTWQDWMELALDILQHPLTQAVAPDLHTAATALGLGGPGPWTNPTVAGVNAAVQLGHAQGYTRE